MIAPRLILASASPRRRALLSLGGWPFELRTVDALEVPHPGEAPPDFVQRLSLDKARLAAEGLGPGALVVGADTVVSLDGRILGKPADERVALEMLAALRGRDHEVYTGLTLLDTTSGRADTQVARSRVPMRGYGDDEVAAFVAAGHALDKAGAYAIQHAGFQPVDLARFGDCFANVMGLPLCHLLRRLRALGLEPAADLPAACQSHLQYACPVWEGILHGD